MSIHFITGEITPQVAADFYHWLGEREVGDWLVLSSPGGDVGLMIGMYDAIVEQDIEIVATGILQSAAAVLFQAGAKRYMYPNAMLRFHEMQRDKDTDNMSDPEWYLLTKLVAMVVQRSGLTLPEGHDLFDGKFIPAKRAVELGLCDGLKNYGGSDGASDRISGGEGPSSGDSNQSAEG